MADNTIVVSGGMSLSTTIFVVFLILKLTDNIDWSWWWVTSPLWIGIAATVALLVVMGILALIVAFFDR